MESRPHHPPVSQLGVFALFGTLDASSHRRVRAVLGAALAHAAARHLPEIVVDLSAVRSADAEVVRLLAGAHESALESGRRLRVSGAGLAVQQALEAAGAGRRLFVHEINDPARLAAVLLDGSADLERASAGRRRAEDDQVRLGRRLQQQAVDWEVRSTRRALLAGLRHRLRTEPRALAGEDFLVVADRPAVVAGILTAATTAGGADGCDLHVHDPRSGLLRSAGLRGLPAGLRTRVPSMPDGRPRVVDDITGDPIFAGQPALAALLAAGLLAVRCYQLRDGSGRSLGVLTMHFRTAARRPADADRLARDAESALAQLPEPVTARPGRPAPPG
ncbi:STAS domain-containing protein [Actinoplanes sp. TRM 88003]|uniref:STAS domain-containing protein n=1 Tax=Paractinoplanes aksuensis TaxID=2939490 RepID=A0ABT1DH48_9ACTN|nr:STAS domain-containing protein [Actinoplanes aksuensis]MCO8270127.1 STAS domain-containing protein [Actinoplanes aksuensis]